MAELTVLKTVRAEQTAADKEKLLAYLDTLRTQAASGELTGLLVISETTEEYSYTRLNLTFQESIALHTRAAYKLNQEWDV